MYMYYKAIGRDDVQSDSFLIQNRYSCCKLRGYDCCSEPFGKPNICNVTGKFIHVIKNIRHVSQFTRLNKNLDFKLDQSKHLLKKLSREMNRLSKVKVPCLLTSINEDYWSQSECCSFMLRWAEELKNIHPTGRKTSKGHDNQPDRQHGCQMSSAQQDQLKEARRILSDWAASLKSLPEGSVCLEKDQWGMVEDLVRQWKMGHLPNMLSALDSLMCVLIERSCQTRKPYQMQLSKKLSPQTLVC